MANPQNSIGLFAARNIDGAATGTTDIFTPDAIEAYRSLWVTISLISGLNITTTPIISVGFGGPNFEDILPLTTLPAGLAVTRTVNYFLSPSVGPTTGISGAGGAAIKINVRTAATGIGIIYTFDTIISGYYDV